MDVVRLASGEPQSLTGRILVTAGDGGLLVEGRDGVLWTIEPTAIHSLESNEHAFTPLDRSQFTAALLAELPPGFQAHHTAHYVICHDTSRDYAAWCGGLFERLFWAFENFWSRRSFDLVEPAHPLPVIVFTSAEDYARFARPELGDAASSVVAYYSLRTNRVVMHDLTGVEAVRSAAGARTPALGIQGLLSQPAAEPLVATVVHEATHQIAFSGGLHTRYSDVPVWLSEGLAIYFETPDLSATRGWRGIGRVNHRRLSTFRQSLADGSKSPVAALVANDRLFRDTRTGPEAYAQAWALTYYLLRSREDAYVAYLHELAAKPRLVWDDESTRLAEFQKHFGNLDVLDAQVREYLGRLR
jgi:hypothetical protein